MSASALSAVAPGRFKLPVEVGNSKSLAKKSEVSSEEAMLESGHGKTQDVFAYRAVALSTDTNCGPEHQPVNGLTQIFRFRRPRRLADRVVPGGILQAATTYGGDMLPVGNANHIMRFRRDRRLIIFSKAVHVVVIEMI